MSLEENILIERFLKKTLSKKEQELFLEKMDNDLMFRKKVDFEKQLSETLNDENWSFAENNNGTQIKEYTEILKSEEIKKIKKTIQNVNRDYQKTTKKKYTKWILYASVAVITILLSIYTFFDSSFSSQELYSLYLQNENLPSLVTREGHQNELAKGQVFFENKNYDLALTIFKKELLQSENQNAVIYLYLGISQMELHQFQEAEKTFDLLISSNLIDASKGTWYKALLYLKTDQINQSKLLLNKIVNNRLYNYKQASELLKKLP